MQALRRGVPWHLQLVKGARLDGYFDCEAFYGDEFFERCGYVKQGILLRAFWHQVRYGSVPDMQHGAYRSFAPRGTPEEQDEFLEAWSELVEDGALVPAHEEGRLVLVDFDRLFVTRTVCDVPKNGLLALPLLGTHGPKSDAIALTQAATVSEVTPPAGAEPLERAS